MVTCDCGIPDTGQVGMQKWGPEVLIGRGGRVGNSSRGGDLSVIIALELIKY